MAADKKPRREKPPYKKPDRDSDLDVINDLIAGSTVSAVFYNTYLSRSAIRNIMVGKTRKPQHMTMTGLAASQGFKWKLVKAK
jgi:hypothetical protein